MALAATTIAEIRTGGSDTANGGLFDPSKVSAGGWTDGAATSATGNSPVFTSASYNFVAGDVGAWLYIDSGTNWTPGWYQIASVAANAATLSAALGAGVLAGNTGMTTVAGCATVTSPTGAKWTIDYSQQNAAQFTYTDLASAGTGLTVSSAAQPLGRQMVGNAIVITGGTNFNTGRYVIASVAAVTFIATVVGPTNITTGAGVSGTGGQGGALLSPGLWNSIIAAGNLAFIKNDGSVFSITSTTAAISQGCLNNSLLSFLVGYSTNRTVPNTDSAPTIQLNVSTATMFAPTSSRLICINQVHDGNNQTAAKHAVSCVFYRCLFKNFNTASSGTSQYAQCQATANSATIFAGLFDTIEAWANTATPISGGGTRILSYSNTGASTDGISNTGVISNGIFYGNGRDGVRIVGTSGTISLSCHSEGNTGVGFSSQAGAAGRMVLKSCSTFNNTGGISTGSPMLDTPITATMELAASPLTNPGAGDFSLNSTASAALLKGAGTPQLFPRGLTASRPDVGAAQHADPPGPVTVF